ncbi:alkene reductase [Nitratireductor aestuarii]|uniref:Alkene reductase n=1 Tax=Nitratireductor aestuarii TaxID=1735103 RepID=A0A916RN33_9HYPH|nr:alkene reductase [Nitratireductor aestuarii]GGA63429.1 alkene reductase [Nitratireductor aestuarii]
MEELFTPMRLGALELRNRIVMSAMTRSRAGEGDTPTDLHVEYYRQRAGAGLIVTEGVQPSPAGKGYCRTPGIYSRAQIEGWRRVADAVHREGSQIVLQIMHCGRVASRSNKDDDSEIVAPSAIRCNQKIFTDTFGLMDMDEPRALDTDEIPGVVNEFRQAALNAREAGMDGVELHCSSGYLPMQFLSSNTNQRTDRYGGSARNRIRFVMEVLEAMGEAIGFERVGLRVCPGFEYNDIHDENPVETYGLLFDEASKLGLAYLHLVRRTFPKVDNYALVKERWRGNFILNNELTGEMAAEAIRSGDADAVSFGRPFIGNPDLPSRLRRGIPLSGYDVAKTYTPGPAGYIDYPVAS